MNLRLFSILHRFGLIATPLVLVAITILSLLPPSGAVTQSWFTVLGDKWGHFLAYAALGFSMFCAIAKNPCQQGCDHTWRRVVRINRWRMVSLFLFILSIGVIIEFVQPLFGRGFEILDIVADGLGGITGIMVGTIAVMIAEHFESRRGEQR
ncbi:MAG TPA: VanZ family protein [Sphaerochaetaceae bacterium]|nr:VanZ family protein [Sphaerochaetaceae bacterium]